MPASRALRGLPVSLTLAATALGCASLPGRGPEAVAEPRLVLVLVVDQLRRDRLDERLPDGLGRLVREGRSFPFSTFLHSRTATCPGHATISTGRHPRSSGIAGNTFIDRETWKVVYCVEDEADDAAVFGMDEKRSPRSLRVNALGDWLHEAYPDGRVFAVAGKDRAAIAMGGQQPDGVYWIDWDSGRPTTSRYYVEALPAWLEAWQPGELPPRWTHPERPGVRIDDYPAEADWFSRTSPHPMDEPKQVRATPYADRMVLELATALVDAEGLGTDRTPDLLAVGLSATDLVGHVYGPWSQEAADALLQLDRDLAAFLAHLESIVGPGGLLVALTADHGVLPLPEWEQEQARSACPIPGGRIDSGELRDALEDHLSGQLGPAPDGGWFVHAGFHLAVPPETTQRAGIPRSRILHEISEFLGQHPIVERVWTREQVLEGGGDGPSDFRALYANSLPEGRGGDLIVQPRRDCLLNSRPYGTSHGSPYAYDREVPLVFWGAGVDVGIALEPAGPVDLAPTLARSLGIEIPEDVEGRALRLSE